MKILFLNIASMKYYKGAASDDMPTGMDGEELNSDIVYEKYNFDPVKAPNGEFCLGYFDVGEEEELFIENIEDTDMEAEIAENVTVVWCAPYKDGRLTVVGWYGDATVGRGYDELEFDDGYVQVYNIIDDADNCVLLPYDERGNLKWNVPVSDGKHPFGMSKANIWFATELECEDFVRILAKNIRTYKGDNWLGRYPESGEEI